MIISNYVLLSNHCACGYEHYNLPRWYKQKKMYDISFICYNRCGRIIYLEFGVYTELLDIATAVH